MNTRLRLPALLLPLSLLTSAAHATITVQNFWSLNDASAPFVDSVGGKNLDGGFGTRTPSSSVVAPGATGSLYFGGAAGIYANGSPNFPNIYADNVVLELWVNPTALPDHDDFLLMCDFGGTAGSMQLGLHNGQWAFGINSVSYGDSGIAATTGVWTNLAFVIDNGVAKAYVNGTQISTALSAPSLTGIQQILVGCGAGGGYKYAGYLDALRYSTFAPGQFSASDLMVNAVPEPGTYGLATLAAISLAAIVRRRRA